MYVYIYIYIYIYIHTYFMQRGDAESFKRRRSVEIKHGNTVRYYTIHHNCSFTSIDYTIRQNM